MNTEILISNMTNPTLLFFLLGVVAVLVKSDLRIPESTSKFISLYLLLSIGFKGGQELQHSGLTPEVTYTLIIAILFALFAPLVNGMLAAFITHFLPMEPGNKLLLCILAASASYIAVPAAMQLAAPKADPGLYIPMALGITFPLNITIGIPLYWSLVS
jgi:hypothetical protein